MKFIGINFTNFSQLSECSIFKVEQREYTFSGFGENSTLIIKDPLTDLELREVVHTGLCVPVATLWLEVSKEVAEGKCPTDLGDGRRAFDNEYYFRVVDNRYFYIVGRTNEHGNYEGPLSIEVFNTHINLFGIDNLYQVLPQSNNEIQ